VAVASCLVQTVSGIREGNEVQVEDDSDFNVYVSDAAMSSSQRMYYAVYIWPIFLSIFVPYFFIFLIHHRRC